VTAPLPEIAVVVPMRDASDTVAETIGSIAAQTVDRAAIEVLVVDDGSIDGGGQIADDALRRGRLTGRLLRTAGALGPSAARNLGWRAARAPWIQFLDADDLVGPEKLALQLPAARASAPDTCAVHSAWARLEPAGGRWVPSSVVVDPTVGTEPLADLLRADNFLHTGCALFRRSALERVAGFDTSLRLVEDVDLLMRLALDGGRFLRVHAAGPLFWYRQRPGSLSRRDEGAFVDACLRNTRRAEVAWRADGPLTASRREVLAGLYGQAARHYAERDRSRFEELVSHIGDLDPGFVPSGPEGLRRLSQVVGYRAAERFAVRYRRARRLLQR